MKSSIRNSFQQSLTRIQLLSSDRQPCSYLADRQARSQFVMPAHMVDTSLYAQLLEQGFRRSGLYTYRPHCGDCQACVPMRIPVAQFSPGRSQRRAWRQHAGLTAQVLPLQFVPEHYRLYQHYQRARHTDGGMAEHDEQDYRDFILASRVHACLVEFRDGQHLKMVALTDLLPQALSAVYTFYADEPHTAYGTYAILWQIDWAQRRGADHLYLGYWVADSQKMHYKARFRPAEIRQDGQWQRMPDGDACARAEGPEGAAAGMPAV